MAQRGLKGYSIAYTNSSGSTKTMTITRAAKFSIWSKESTINIWTQTQEEEGAKNGQATYKQTFDIDTPFASDSYGFQLSCDHLEDIKVEVPNGAKVHGFIWGQACDWTVS